MPNIYDVAREAGVSRSTVSRVINNQKSVKDDKRKQVLMAIKKLNYTPNATARALALKRTNTIGVISRELTETFNAKFINEVHHYADNQHYGVIYCMRKHTTQANINYIDFLNKKVDGFIFIGENTVTEEELENLSKAQIPVVAMEVEYPVEHVTFLNIDNFESSYNAVKYLYELGHRRLVNITANEPTQEKEARKAGFNKACEDMGMDFFETVETPYYIGASKTCIQELIPNLLENNITAGFCYNNVIGTMLAEELIVNGKSIPDDFSIIGFDDIHYGNISRVAIPELSSIRQPQKEMAEYAVEKLLEAINRKKDSMILSESKVFNCELKIHESTGRRNKV